MSEERKEPLALVFGEALWDLLPSGPVLGGAPLNFAYRLGSLGVPTQFVSQVGTDELGDRTLARMSELGMDLSMVSRTSGLPTATVIVELDEKKNPTYTIVENVAYDAIPWSLSLETAARAAGILCFGTLAQRDERSRNTLRRIVDSFAGHTVLVDINLRRNCWTEETVRWSLRQGTMAKLNDEELLVLADIFGIGRTAVAEMALRLRKEADLDVLVVTMGAEGALAVDAAEDPVVSPGFSVQVADPCGAGDAFAGMFLASLVQGRPLEEALRRANALGALVTAQPGATQPVSLDEVEALITGDLRRAGLT